MRVDIMTLFPGTVNAVLHESIIGRAAKKGILEINCVQIRDYTENRQGQVDDYPYGGGWGCVMAAQPLKSCLQSILDQTQDRKTRVIYMTPQGAPYTQDTARRLARDYDHLVLVCGHYEGIDERFIEACVDEEISLGDFVLTGGEIAAMAVTDSVCRLIPGVLADEECYTGESHWDGLLEYPQYTRPEVWEGRKVPEVLIDGNHARVAAWRREKQFERTMTKRPDMFARLNPSDPEDRRLMQKVIKNAGRKKLTEPVTCRPAVPEDITAILDMVAFARKSLKKHRVDQWQGVYPDDKVYLADMERGECFLVLHGNEPAAVFTLSCLPEPDYDGITDGKWTEGLEYCVIHRCAVAEDYRGTGMSEQMLALAEELTLRNGRRCVRLDTHCKNKAMLNLLRGNGYRYRGNITCESEPGHDPARQAYEKILKVKK